MNFLKKQLILVAQKMLSLIREYASKKDIFTLAIPPEYGIGAGFVYLRLLPSRRDLQRQNSELKLVCQLNSVDLWRE